MYPIRPTPTLPLLTINLSHWFHHWLSITSGILRGSLILLEGLKKNCRPTDPVLDDFTTPFSMYRTSLVSGWLGLDFFPTKRGNKIHIWVVATQTFFIFTPTLGVHDPIWREYFSHGLVQPPTRYCIYFLHQLSNNKLPKLPKSEVQRASSRGTKHIQIKREKENHRLKHALNGDIYVSSL